MINLDPFVYQPSVTIAGVDTAGPVVKAENYSAMYLIVDITAIHASEWLQIILMMQDPVVDGVGEIITSCSKILAAAGASFNAVGTYYMAVGVPSVPLSQNFSAANSLTVAVPLWWRLQYNTNDTGEDITFSVGVIPYQRN